MERPSRIKIPKVRWTTGKEGQPAFFPEDKYRFTELLTNVGDFVRTPPLGSADRKKFRNAAYDWAWRHKYKVSIKFFRKSEDTWEVECTLTSKVFGRDFL